MTAFAHTHRLGRGHRMILGLAGLVPLLAPLHLWRGVWPFSVATPLFAVIILGALGISAVLLFASIANPTEQWRADASGLTIERRWLLGRRMMLFEPARILGDPGVQLEKDESTEGSPTFRLVVRDHTGKTWRIWASDDEDAALSLLVTLRAAVQ